MLATDPLSLVFVTCIVLSSTFLIGTTLLGIGHGHGMHLHVGHAGHVGHLGAHTTAHVAVPASAHLTPQPGLRVQLPNHSATAPTPAATSGPGAPLAQVLSAINLNAVVIFLFCFGILGYLLHNTAHLNAVVALVLALIIGVTISGGVNVLLLRLMGHETGNLGADSSQMEGRLATVSLPVRAGGIGEIIYVGENGSRHSLGARSVTGQAIPRAADVVIVAYEQGIATVETWDSFLISAQPAMPAHQPG